MKETLDNTHISALLKKLKKFNLEPKQILEIETDLVDFVEHHSRPSFVDYDELNRYKSLVQNNDLGIFSISRMNLTTVNQACIDILGYTEEELLSNGLEYFLYHEDLPLVGLMAHKVISGEINSHYTEIRYVNKSGELRHCGVSLSAIRDSKGNYVESTGTFSDITDRVRAVAALEESRNSFAVLYHNMFEAVLKYDYLNDRLLDFNDATINLLGFDSDTLKGMGMSQLIPKYVSKLPGVDLHNVLLSHRENVLKGENFVSRGHFLKKDGSTVFANISVIPQNPELGIAYVIINDRTKETQQQEALIASEEKYRTIFENSPMAIISSDLEGTIELASASAEQMLVTKRDDKIIGRSFLDFIEREERKKWANHLKKQSKESKPIKLATRLYLDDGSTRNIEGLAIPVKDENDSTTSLLQMFFDNTDKIRAEKQAQKFENQYSKIFEFSPAPIINTDLSGNILLASPSALKILGYSAGELQNMSLNDIVIHKDWKILKKAFASYVRHGSPFRSHYRCQTKSGNLRILEGEGFPIKNERDEISMISHVFFDNTELHAAQEALDKSHQQYRNIFKYSRQAILSTHVESMKIIECNQEAINMFKSQHRNHLIDHRLVDFLAPVQLDNQSSIDRASQNHELLIREGVVTSQEKYFRQDGKELIVNSTAVLDSTEDYQRIIYFLTDITTEFRATEKLKSTNAQLQKYIDSNIQLEQFAHIASHDLKSPLRTVSSFTGLLRDRIDDRINDHEREFLGYIEKGTQQMSNLINDLLTYSKVNSQALKLSSIFVDTMVKSVLHDLGSYIDEGNAKITTEGLDRVIVADSVKLRRVFQNLISNALKFQEEGRNPEVHIKLDEDQHYWIASIKDNGIGISPQFHDRIFERFTHLNSNEKYDGTGMGLAICKKTIEQHQGRIIVKSDIDRGSEFIFTIPKIK